MMHNDPDKRLDKRRALTFIAITVAVAAYSIWIIGRLT